MLNREISIRKVVKCLRIRWPMQEMYETQVRSLGQEDALEEEMVTHSRILARKISWTEEPGRLQSIGLKRIEHY